MSEDNPKVLHLNGLEMVANIYASAYRQIGAVEGIDGVARFSYTVGLMEGQSTKFDRAFFDHAAGVNGWRIEWEGGAQ